MAKMVACVLVGSRFDYAKFAVFYMQAYHSEKHL